MAFEAKFRIPEVGAPASGKSSSQLGTFDLGSRHPLKTVLQACHPTWTRGRVVMRAACVKVHVSTDAIESIKSSLAHTVLQEFPFLHLPFTSACRLVGLNSRVAD